MDYMKLLEHRMYSEQASDEFARTYSEIAGNLSPKGHTELKDILAGTKPMEGFSEEERNEIQFGAFYVLCVYYRRRKDYQAFSKLVSDCHGKFASRELYLFQEAVCLKSGFPNVRELNSAKAVFEQIRTKNPYVDQMPFFIQAYASTVAAYYDDRPISELNDNDRNEVKEAIVLQRNAVAIRPDYAKYYYTLAKLYHLVGEHEAAKENIRKAIEFEDSRAADYALRVNAYEILNSRIDLEQAINNEVKSLKKMQSDFEGMKDDLEKSKVDNLSFLGFFTGIISFILGSFQLGAGLDFSNRIQMMGVFLGCLLIAFSVFRLIIGKYKAKDLVICGIAVFSSLVLIWVCSMLF